MSDHTPTSPTATPPTAPPPPEPTKTLWDRIPRRLFGGKVRTNTAALVLLFLAALLLYGQRSDHYEAVDEEARQAALSQVQQPRTSTPEAEVPATEPEITSTPDLSETPTTTETTDTTDTTDPAETEPDAVPAPESTSESTRGGILPRLDLPTIPAAP